jgi:Fic family protein
MHKTLLKNILVLKKIYDTERVGKESLLKILSEVEVSEAVYNSNAIENSTLTLDATEKILLENDLPSQYSKREVFEAINLGRVYDYVEQK